MKGISTAWHINIKPKPQPMLLKQPKRQPSLYVMLQSNLVIALALCITIIAADVAHLPKQYLPPAAGKANNGTTEIAIEQHELHELPEQIEYKLEQQMYGGKADAAIRELTPPAEHYLPTLQSTMYSQIEELSAQPTAPYDLQTFTQAETVHELHKDGYHYKIVEQAKRLRH